MIQRGGADLERLYLKDLEFISSDEAVHVRKTQIDGVDMDDLIARHKARYALCGLFLRPGYEFLDFPCGSGYAVNVLKPFGASYTGMDFDWATLAYADFFYGGKFCFNNLCDPNLPSAKYDTIGCIEGLEHIDALSQFRLIDSFWKALKFGGTLIVSSPEAIVSGPNPDNPYHLNELSRQDFQNLLGNFFSNVEIVSHQERLSTGKLQTCLYGVCHKQ